MVYLAADLFISKVSVYCSYSIKIEIPLAVLCVCVNLFFEWSNLTCIKKLQNENMPLKQVMLVLSVFSVGVLPLFTAKKLQHAPPGKGRDISDTRSE